MDVTTLLVLGVAAAAILVATQGAIAQPDPGATIPIDPGAPPLDPWQGASSGGPWYDPGSGLPIIPGPGDPGLPLDPQPSGPPDQPPTGDPGGTIQTPGPATCGPANPELCIPFATGATTGPIPAGTVWLPGDPHVYDNQIVYACSSVGMTDAFAPYVLKTIISREQGYGGWNPLARGDGLTCRQIDPQNSGCCGPYRGDASFTGYASIGLGQINRCANPGVAASYDLRDPNANIYAAAIILLGAYNPLDWFTTIRAYNGSGPAAVAYAQDVYARAKGLAAQAGVIPAS